MAGRDVFAHPEPGRAEGALLRILHNVLRGKRQKEGLDDVIPCILEPQENEKAFRKSWARLIQKIYEVDLLVCPKLAPAEAGMSGVHADQRSIEDLSVIRDILNHLGLWLVRATPSPKSPVTSKNAL